MSSDWNKFVLSDLYEFSSGLSKNSKEFGFGSPFLSFKTVFNNYFIPSKLNELANTTQVEQEKCSIKKGDVFLTRTSETMNELGMSCVALKDYPHATFNGFTKRLRPKEKDIVYPLFAGYYFRSIFFRNTINSMAIMTTRASLNNEILSKLPMLIPSYETQEKIGKILFNLDKKIELNQKMNQTLEEIGQAIFKHWFVHFEFPDEEGKPYKSSGGEMVDSELGEIPKGWEVKKLSEICSKVIDGTHDSPSPEDEGYYLVTGRHIINGIIDFSKCYKISPEEHQKVMMRSKPEKGDTIFSNIGTLGTATFVDQDFEFSIKNVALFKPLKPIYSSFIYLYFLFPNTVKIMENSSSGTTQRFFSLKFLRGWELIKPSDGILLKFDNFIQPLLEMRTSLNAQNKNLSQIRDSFLPKLMSGKIRVK